LITIYVLLFQFFREYLRFEYFAKHFIYGYQAKFKHYHFAMSKYFRNLYFRLEHFRNLYFKLEHFRNLYFKLEHFINLYFKHEHFRNYLFAMFKYYYFAEFEELVVNQLQFKHIEVLPMFK
jgi:hypothetical protein